MPIDGREVGGAATDDLEHGLFRIFTSEPMTPERPEDFALAPRSLAEQTADDIAVGVPMRRSALHRIGARPELEAERVAAQQVAPAAGPGVPFSVVR